MRESHKSRTIFRKVGGFVHIVSVLVSLEGCLKKTQDPPLIACDTYRLLQSVFACLAVAMRYEPANAWHFQTEIAGGSSSKHFVETVRNLGCFDPSADTIKTDLRESNSAAATAEAKKEGFATISPSRQPFSYKEYAPRSGH